MQYFFVFLQMKCDSSNLKSAYLIQDALRGTRRMHAAPPKFQFQTN